MQPPQSPLTTFHGKELRNKQRNTGVGCGYQINGDKKKRQTWDGTHPNESLNPQEVKFACQVLEEICQKNN